MPLSEQFKFYARKSMRGVIFGAAMGILSFMWVEHSRSKGMTAQWLEQRDSTKRPESEEYSRERFQQELWVDSLFADIPDETKERVTQRWTGKSYLEQKAKREVEKQEFINKQVEKSRELKELYKTSPAKMPPQPQKSPQKQPPQTSIE